MCVYSLFLASDMIIVREGVNIALPRIYFLHHYNVSMYPVIMTDRIPHTFLPTPICYYDKTKQNNARIVLEDLVLCLQGFVDIFVS